MEGGSPHVNFEVLSMWLQETEGVRSWIGSIQFDSVKADRRCFAVNLSGEDGMM